MPEPQATPRPWHWNETTSGWGGQLVIDEESYAGDKYLDLALRGPDNVGIINLRIDHYEPEWDQYPEEVKTADREYLVTAVNAHDELVALVRNLYETLRQYRQMITANEGQLMVRARTLLDSISESDA